MNSVSHKIITNNIKVFFGLTKDMYKKPISNGLVTNQI